MPLAQTRAKIERLEKALLKQQTSPAPTPKEAQRLRLARTELLSFTTHTFPAYVADPAHVLLAEALDAVVRGDLKRLMVFAPPQHGKSHLASVHLPALWLGRRPDDPIILASYAASLAESKSRQARQLVEATEFQELFPGIGTRRDSRAVDHWELDGHRGGMLAVGVGGPVTGHGGLLGVIDDPVENWQEAQSATVRETSWQWYRTTFRTRIWEGGAIVLVMTRWHEDDLAGRLLAEQRGEWSVLRLPALAETQAERDRANVRLGLPAGAADPLGRAPGEPLCPRRFSREALEQLRRDVGSLAWAGQYQGVPTAAEGNRFKRSWFPVVEAAPARAARCRYWDLAATQDGGDYTAGVLLSRDAAGVFYVEDVARGQWSPAERDRVMLETTRRDARSHGNTVLVRGEQEPGSSGKSAAAAIVRLLAGFPVLFAPVTGSKEVRAEPFAAQAEAGNVRLVRGAWNGPYIEELTAFPNGRNDDMVDGSSGAFAYLTTQPASAGRPRFPGGGQRLPPALTL
jgi:predicted phage terminase large subunit-like protein